MCLVRGHTLGHDILLAKGHFLVLLHNVSPPFSGTAVKLLQNHRSITPNMDPSGAWWVSSFLAAALMLLTLYMLSAFLERIFNIHVRARGPCPHGYA